jgi:hypothetical protein
MAKPVKVALLDLYESVENRDEMYPWILNQYGEANHLDIGLDEI